MLLACLGCDRLLILYTHSDDVASWELALEWYVEDQGTLLGPFTSAARASSSQARWLTSVCT